MESPDAPPEGPPGRSRDPGGEQGPVVHSNSPTEKPSPGTGGHFVQLRRTALAMCPQPEPLHLTRRKWKKGQRQGAGGGLESYPSVLQNPRPHLHVELPAQFSCPRLNLSPWGVTPPRSLPKLPPVPAGSRAGNSWERDRTQQIK